VEAKTRSPIANLHRGSATLSRSRLIDPCRGLETVR
jgi:hypothetical protein